MLRAEGRMLKWLVLIVSLMGPRNAIESLGMSVRDSLQWVSWDRENPPWMCSLGELYVPGNWTNYTGEMEILQICRNSCLTLLLPWWMALLNYSKQFLHWAQLVLHPRDKWLMQMFTGLSPACQWSTEPPNRLYCWESRIKSFLALACLLYPRYFCQQGTLSVASSKSYILG